MEFLSFKSFLKKKEDEEEELKCMIEQLAKEGLYELRHNILFSDKIRGLKFNRLNEDDIDPALRKKLNNELTAIFAVFLPCVKFLGPNRMKKIVNVINQRLTKPSKEILRDASKNPIKDANGKTMSLYDYNRTKSRDYNSASDAEKKEIDDEYNDLQVLVYSLCVRQALTKDETGLDRSKVKFEIKSKKIVYELLEGWFGNLMKGIGDFLAKLLNAIFGKPQNGKEADEKKVENMFSPESRNCKPDATDEEKKSCNVTWVKEVTMADIKIMNFNKNSNKFGNNSRKQNVINKDVDTNLVKSGDTAKYGKSFLKSIVLISLKYGPACLNYLMDASKKAIENENKQNNQGTQNNP